MPSHGYRGWPNPRQGFILAAILTGPAWMAAIAATLVPTIPAGTFMVIAAVAAFVLANQVFPERGIGLLVCGVLAMLAAIVAFAWAPLAVLDLWGDRVRATVTAEHIVSGQNRLYRYELSGPDGKAMAGMLTEYDDLYQPGDLVDVVVDPRSRSIRRPPLISTVSGRRESQPLACWCSRPCWRSMSAPEDPWRRSIFGSPGTEPGTTTGRAQSRSRHRTEARWPRVITLFGNCSHQRPACPRSAPHPAPPSRTSGRRRSLATAAGSVGVHGNETVGRATVRALDRFVPARTSRTPRHR